MTYFELTSIKGHDTFLLDINNMGVAIKVGITMGWGMHHVTLPSVISYRATWSTEVHVMFGELYLLF